MTITSIYMFLHICMLGSVSVLWYSLLNFKHLAEFFMLIKAKFLFFGMMRTICFLMGWGNSSFLLVKYKINTLLWHFGKLKSNFVEMVKWHGNKRILKFMIRLIQKQSSSVKLPGKSESYLKRPLWNIPYCVPIFQTNITARRNPSFFLWNRKTKSPLKLFVNWNQTFQNCLIEVYHVLPKNIRVFEINYVLTSFLIYKLLMIVIMMRWWNVCRRLLANRFFKKKFFYFNTSLVKNFNCRYTKSLKIPKW